MTIDQYLIIRARDLANGRYIHEVENMIAPYIMAVHVVEDAHSPDGLALAEETEKTLRAFVHVRLVEKTMRDLKEYQETL